MMPAGAKVFPKRLRSRSLPIALLVQLYKFDKKISL
jgi:hypothetical protein